jgi:hypothetical protein
MQITWRVAGAAVLVGMLRTGSVCLAFFDGFLLGFCAFDLPARCQPLVAQHAQLLDFWALAAAFAEFKHFDIAWAGHAVFVHCALFFWLGAPQDQKLTNVLHWGRTKVGGQLLVHRLACSAVVAEDANLDQAMCIQSGIDFFLYGGGQTIAANQNHGVQMVGLGTLFPALGWGKFNLRHGRIIEAGRTFHENQDPKQKSEQGMA